MNKSKILSYAKVLEKRLFFRYLLHLNQEPGVYALINNKHKKIYIQASPNVTKSLGDVIAQIASRICTNKDVIRDRKYLSIKILEHGDFPFINKLKWIAHYRSLGWEIYNKEVLPTYKVRMQFVHRDVVRTQVQLISGGKKIFPIKNCKSKEEAKEFIASHTVYDMLKMLKSR